MYVYVFFKERKFVDVINLNLISWFPSNHLLRNVTTIIRNITVSSSDLKSVEVNESIISLLLNIYLKYNPNICIDLDDTSKLNQRIGSAKDFIEKILVRLVSLSQRCRYYNYKKFVEREKLTIIRVLYIICVKEKKSVHFK